MIHRLYIGSNNETKVLEIATGDNKKVNLLANELKVNLTQQAIGYQILPELNFI